MEDTYSHNTLATVHPKALIELTGSTVAALADSVGLYPAAQHSLGTRMMTSGTGGYPLPARTLADGALARALADGAPARTLANGCLTACVAMSVGSTIATAADGVQLSVAARSSSSGGQHHSASSMGTSLHAIVQEIVTTRKRNRRGTVPRVSFLALDDDISARLRLSAAIIIRRFAHGRCGGLITGSTSIDATAYDGASTHTGVPWVKP